MVHYGSLWLIPLFSIALKSAADESEIESGTAWKRFKNAMF